MLKHWTPCFDTMEEYASNTVYMGTVEVSKPDGEFEAFEVVYGIVGASRRLIFGGACNVGFLESGYMTLEEHEEPGNTLHELRELLEEYYHREGAEYSYRLVINERM